MNDVGVLMLSLTFSLLSMSSIVRFLLIDPDAVVFGDFSCSGSTSWLVVCVDTLTLCNESVFVVGEDESDAERDKTGAGSPGVGFSFAGFNRS